MPSPVPLRLCPSQEKKAAAKAAERAARKAQKNVLGFSSSSSSSDSDPDARRLKRQKTKAKRSASAVGAAAGKKPAWLEEVEKRDREVFDMEYAKPGEARAWDAGKVDVVEQLARAGGGGGGKGGKGGFVRAGSYDY